MKKLILAIFLVVFQIAAVIVSAEESNERLLSIVHSGTSNYFEYTAVPGEEVFLEFELYNNTDKSITNSLLLYDACTAVNGGNIIMTPSDFTAVKTAAWFNINTDEITLCRGEITDRKIQFTVPEDTIPGEYTAIIALYAEDESSKEQNENSKEKIEITINNHFTTTLAVVIRVGNNPKREIILSDRASFTLEKSSGRSFLYIPITNSGFTYEFPEVSVEIRDKSQKLLFSDKIAMDIIYMDTKASACIETTGSLSEHGVYDIKAEMTTCSGEVLDKKDYKCSVKKEDVKKTIIKEAENTIPRNPGWGSGFFVMNKEHVYIAGGITVTVLCTLFVFLLKKRYK